MNEMKMISLFAGDGLAKSKGGVTLFEFLQHFYTAETRVFGVPFAVNSIIVGLLLLKLHQT